jgi:hypothetical protein
VWLVLSQGGDPDGAWIAERLRDRLGGSVEHVTADQLVHGATWEHRLADDGVQTVVHLDDGRVLRSQEIRAVLNRLVWMGAEGYAGASPADRTYASGELQALALSWLASLGGRVLCPPSAVALCGAYRPATHWRWLARQAGVPVASGCEASDLERYGVVVVDGDVVSERVLDDRVAEPLRRMADTNGMRLFEARFVDCEERMLFEDVALLPWLTPHGDLVVDAVLAALIRCEAVR